jgi:hypothetical protein
MSKRILVVEDEEDSRRILRDLLSSADYEMTEAEKRRGGVDCGGKAATGPHPGHSLFTDRARSFHSTRKTDVAHVNEPRVYRRWLPLLRLHRLLAARALHNGKSSPTILRCHADVKAEP